MSTFHFADRLNQAIQEKKSPVCVGLDPRLEKIPQFIRDKHFSSEKNPFKAAAESIIEFNKAIIDAIADVVPAVKPQIAFYEQYEHEGMRAFEETNRYAKEKGLLTIADVKRGDIGSTAEAYARAYLGKVDVNGKEQMSMDVDAVTIAPYLGWDGVKPFVEEGAKHGKGIFVLVKTSNVSSADLQDLKMEDQRSVYEIMAQYVDSWGADEIGESGYSMVGAVVGATFPDQLKDLRMLLPQAIFLVPVYGAQGGTADDVKGALDENGLVAILNSSRGIIFAWEKSDTFNERDFADAARHAAQEMTEAIVKGI